MGEYLLRLLDRAGVDRGPQEELLRDIAKQEQSALLRANGRIEPRSRFKIGSGTPLHDGRSRTFLYIDESGKSGKGPEPVFALAAVAMDQQAANAYVRAANRIKLEFFGTTDVTFHEPQIRRHETVFRLDGDQQRQAELCAALDQMVASTKFTAFGVAVRKQAFSTFLAEEPDAYLPWDVYSVAIHLLLERYVDFLAKAGSKAAMGNVTFESQGPLEDSKHQAAYTELLLNGTQWVPDSSFRNWLETGANFVPKAGSHPTELADMLSRDIFEWARNDCQADPPPRRWGIFGPKIYRRGDMRMGKFGIKVFPDSDIRDSVEAHREACRQVGELKAPRPKGARRR